jgi:hypothetical protein
MMNDRELLELAAKAFGVSVVRGYFGCGECWLTERKGFGLMPWNPLDDDADALRVAVGLGMDIHTGDAQYVFAGRNMSESGIGYCECHENDSLAATRRAIVRAAAEIGRAMQ